MWPMTSTGALGRLGRAKPRDEVGAAVAGIENPRLDPGHAAEERVEMPRDEDLVARRILRIERDELFEQRERVALRGGAIEAGRCAESLATGDAGDDRRGRAMKTGTRDVKLCVSSTLTRYLALICARSKSRR